MKMPSLPRAILRLGHGHRRAAFALALAAIVLLAATSVAVVLVNTGKLRPTPTNRLQSDYLRALDSESEAVNQAKAARHAVDTDSAVVSARADLVLLEIQAGDTGSALRRARGLARGAPQNAEALYSYGMALAASGQTSASLTRYRAASRLVKDSDSELKRNILAAYADALIVTKAPRQAYVALKQAAAIAPASADLYVKAAILATSQQDFQAAAADYLSAQSYDPQNTKAVTGLQQLESAHPDAVEAARDKSDGERPS